MIINQDKPTVLRSPSHDILFNLALENYLFTTQQIKQPLLLLWRNEKSIILGKHQCAWKEVKLDKVNQDKVTIARRPSGGGAVYQDLGNTVFSIHRPVDASKFTFLVDKKGGSYYGDPEPEKFKNLNN